MWGRLKALWSRVIGVLTGTNGGRALLDGLADLVEVMGPVAIDALGQLAVRQVGVAEGQAPGFDKATFVRDAIMGSADWNAARVFAASQGLEIGKAEANRLVELAVGKLRRDARAQAAE